MLVGVTDGLSTGGRRRVKSNESSAVFQRMVQRTWPFAGGVARW